MSSFVEELLIYSHYPNRVSGFLSDVLEFQYKDLGNNIELSKESFSIKIIKSSAIENTSAECANLFQLKFCFRDKGSFNDAIDRVHLYNYRYPDFTLESCADRRPGPNEIYLKDLENRIWVLHC